jgi:fructosamine-3-kinase
MRLAAELVSRVGAAVGDAVVDAEPISGGDINEAYALRLRDGRRVFMKTNARAAPGMFEAEAHGLAWLAEAGALRVPTVLAVEPRFLVLELLEAGRRVADFDERLGRGLAALHRASPGSFGLDADNFIGSLPQSNTTHATWPEFLRVERFEPLVREVIDRRRAPAAWARRFERLYARLAELTGPPEPPARLHGDLWGGNLHADERGEPVILDPAVYGGHREVDLAMMRLFGGFGARVFAAYEEAWPLAPGAAERVALYQLYPLLVHVSLFGGGYVGSVESALSTYV